MSQTSVDAMGLDDEHILSFIDYLSRVSQSFIGYLSPVSDLDLDLYMATEHHDLNQKQPSDHEKDYLWSKVTTGLVHVSHVGGDHDSMVSEPHVKHLAEKIIQHLTLASSRPSKKIKETEQ